MHPAMDGRDRRRDRFLGTRGRRRCGLRRVRGPQVVCLCGRLCQRRLPLRTTLDGDDRRSHRFLARGRQRSRLRRLQRRQGLRPGRGRRRRLQRQPQGLYTALVGHDRRLHRLLARDRQRRRLRRVRGRQAVCLRPEPRGPSGLEPRERDHRRGRKPGLHRERLRCVRAQPRRRHRRHHLHHLRIRELHGPLVRSYRGRRLHRDRHIRLGHRHGCAPRPGRVDAIPRRSNAHGTQRPRDEHFAFERRRP